MSAARRRGVPFPPRAIAHRGASRDRPENTRDAFDEALRQGADGIELDVQLSRDGVPVVHHDRTLARAGGGRRRPHRLDWDALRALRPGPHRLLSLEETVARYAARADLLVELKARSLGDPRHEQLVRAVAGILAARPGGRGVWLLCFDRAVLERAARVAPELPRVWNLKPPARMTGRVARALAGLDALSLDVRTLRPAFAEAARARGLPLFAYTCNTDRTLARALDCGVAGVMSDRPGWLVGRLAARAS